jgi:hypothetical protein
MASIRFLVTVSPEYAIDITTFGQTPSIVYWLCKNLATSHEAFERESQIYQVSKNIWNIKIFA